MAGMKSNTLPDRLLGSGRDGSSLRGWRLLARLGWEIMSNLGTMELSRVEVECQATSRTTRTTTAPAVNSSSALASGLLNYEEKFRNGQNLSINLVSLVIINISGYGDTLLLYITQLRSTDIIICIFNHRLPRLATKYMYLIARLLELRQRSSRMSLSVVQCTNTSYYCSSCTNYFPPSVGSSHESCCEVAAASKNVQKFTARRLIRPVPKKAKHGDCYIS
jgi:hypothetical protein